MKLKKLFWGWELDEQLTTVSTVAVLKDHTNLVRCPKCGSINNFKQDYCGGCGSKFKMFNLKKYKELEGRCEEQQREKWELDEKVTTVSTVAVLKVHYDIALCPKCGSLNSFKQDYCGGCGSKFKIFSLEKYKELESKYAEQQKDKKGQMTVADLEEG